MASVTLAGGVPMLRQPGEAWLYNTCSDIQGVLVARASDRSLPDFLAERIFEPLGMKDTGFHVPAAKHAWLRSVPRRLRRCPLERASGLRVGSRRARLDALGLEPVRPDAPRPG